MDGLVPMADVFKISLPAYVAAGDEISVGITDKLGLYRPIQTIADVVLLQRMGAASTSFARENSVGTIDAAYGTLLPSGGVVANDRFMISYNSKVL